MTGHLIISLAAGYFMGSVPFGLILSRLFGFGDLRRIGSGNIGATNALRAGGMKLALATFLLDAAKGFLAVYFLGIWAGVAAVVGHNYPVWLAFRGGKGVSTSGGFLLGVSPALFAFCFGIWILSAMMTKYSSLSAIIAMVASAALGFAVSTEAGAALCFLAALGLWRHRENIKRLANGTESKISWRKK